MNWGPGDTAGVGPLTRFAERSAGWGMGQSPIIRQKLLGNVSATLDYAAALRPFPTRPPGPHHYGAWVGVVYPSVPENYPQWLHNGLAVHVAPDAHSDLIDGPERFGPTSTGAIVGDTVVLLQTGIPDASTFPIGSTWAEIVTPVGSRGFVPERGPDGGLNFLGVHFASGPLTGPIISGIEHAVAAIGQSSPFVVPSGLLDVHPGLLAGTDTLFPVRVVSPWGVNILRGPTQSARNIDYRAPNAELLVLKTGIGDSNSIYGAFDRYGQEGPPPPHFEWWLVADGRGMFGYAKVLSDNPPGPNFDRATPPVAPRRPLGKAPRPPGYVPPPSPTTPEGWRDLYYRQWQLAVARHAPAKIIENLHALYEKQAALVANVGPAPVSSSVGAWNVAPWLLGAGIAVPLAVLAMSSMGKAPSPSSSSAASARVLEDNVPIYAEPNPNSTIIVRLNRDERVIVPNVLDVTQAPGSELGWYRVRRMATDLEGYVPGELIADFRNAATNVSGVGMQIGQQASAPVPSEPTPYGNYGNYYLPAGTYPERPGVLPLPISPRPNVGRQVDFYAQVITPGSLFIRKGPRTDFSVVSEVHSGDRLRVIRVELPEYPGTQFPFATPLPCANEWWLVSDDLGTVGYTHAYQKDCHPYFDRDLRMQVASPSVRPLGKRPGYVSGPPVTNPARLYVMWQDALNRMAPERIIEALRQQFLTAAKQIPPTIRHQILTALR